MTEYNSLSPYESEKAFADAVENGEDTAWKYIFKQAVIPVACRKHFKSMMDDRGIQFHEILSMLYETMVVKKKIRNFRFGCPLIYWMRFYVMKEIRTFCKKNPRPVSDEEISNVLMDRNASAEEHFSDWEMVQKCFTALWRKNPVRAYVHLLRVRENMSAAQIAEVLGITSGDNVNKIFSRAVADMKELRLEFSGE